MTPPPILILPGYGDSGPEHWQSLWEAKVPACRRVIQRDWMLPRLEEWLDTLARHVGDCEGPPVLVAHSLGCSLVAHWVARSGVRARGALLVAPADVDSPAHTPDEVRGFSPMPLARFPFPSIVVASTDDPFSALSRGQLFARSWGSRLVVLTGAGHINADAGFGEWPQGRTFLRELTGGS